MSRAAFRALAVTVVLAGCTAAARPSNPPGSHTAPGSGVRLVDVAASVGVTLLNVTGERDKEWIIEVNGNGAAFFDYDNDGHLDILIANGSTLRAIKEGGHPMAVLYRNDGRGRFIDVTARAGLTRRGWGMGVCVADYDNDGFQDVYVTGWRGNVLYRNTGNGTFVDATERAGVRGGRWSTNCAFGDYDRDGYVDLYVANYLTFDETKIPRRGSSSGCQYMGISVICGPRGLPGEADTLYRNNGGGTFTDVTEKAGIRDPGFYGFGVIFSDLDDDGWPDIYVANDSTPSFLFRNNRDGTFTEMGVLAGVALSREGRDQAGMGIDIGDYNNNGRFDIYKTNFSHDYNNLYQNQGNGIFLDVAHESGVADGAGPWVGWGTGFVDLDNDGWLDIFVANGHVYPAVDEAGIGTKFLQRKQVFQNVGNGRFRDVTEKIGGGLLVERSARGAAFGDFDNDGDIDVLVINLNDRPTLLRNDGGNRNHWITLRLVGTKSNRDAIGARVTARVGERTQTAEVRSGGSYLSHNDMRIHFGLDKATRIDRLEVRWPSGLVERFENVAANQFLVVTEGKGLAPVKARR